METLHVKLSKEAKAHLEADALAHKTTSGRWLIDCWAEQLPAALANEIYHKMPRRKRILAPSVENDPNACKKCHSRHERIPAIGPWHAQDCPDYARRALHYT